MFESLTISISIHAVLIFAGAAFCLVGAIGVLRFPDVFARMHSSGVTDTLGAMLVISGLIVLAGWTLPAVKLVFILAFLGMTSPTSTHALAKAALHGGEKPVLDQASPGSSPSER